MALFSSVRDLDVDGPMLGAFAGDAFVASWQEDGRDLLAKWSSHDASPELVTPIDPRVVALAASSDGKRIALAGLTKVGTREVVELLVATLAPPSGMRLVPPRAAFGFDGPPKLVWSEDGRRLAVGAMHGSSPEHVLTMVFDLGQEPPTPWVVFGRPVAWQDDRICVALRETRIAWGAEANEEVAWDGTERWTSPDGEALLVRGGDGAVTVTRAGESARPLVRAPASIAWVGPHHLATDDGRALDVLTRQTTDVLPRGGHATLVALAGDGRQGVFTREGAHVWAGV